MNKFAVTVIVAGLIGIGAFFVWAQSSQEVEQKQEEVAETVTKPLTDAKDVDQLTDDKESANQEQIDEVMGE